MIVHQSVLAFAADVLTRPEVAGRRVVEAGAYDMNGSARPYIESLGPAAYTGIDARPGRRVDVVMDAADIPARLGPGCADVVACFEMLEHAPDWQAAMRGMTEALAPGGILVLTTRSPGFGLHDSPGDYWRFTPACMRAILTGAGLEVLCCDPDPQVPGVLAKARKPAGWAWPDGGWDGVEAEPAS